METKVNEANIVILALIYNYMSNGLKTLGIDKFRNFRNKLQFEVYCNVEDERFVFSIVEDKQDIYRFDSESNQLIFNSVLDLNLSQEDFIRTIPKQVIDASLNQKILSLIDVDLEKIKIETEVERRRETTKTYSLSQNSAVNAEKRYHEDLGHKNVVIESARFVQIDSEPGYELTTSWDEEYIHFVIEKPKTYSKDFNKLVGSMSND